CLRDCHPPAQRRRFRGTDDAPWWEHNSERSKRALVDRQEQGCREAFKSHLAGRATGSGTGVKITRDLGTDTAEIERDRIATDLDADTYRDVLAQHHTIVVHKGLGFIHTVGDSVHGGACQALALLEDELNALGERLGTVALEELGEAALPRAYRRNLGPEV